MKILILKFFVLIITLWCLIACLRTANNLLKTFTEERAWVFMTSEEKKVKLYGDVELIYNKILTSSTKSDCVLLETNSDTSFFLLRYLLYPQKVYWINVSDSHLNPPRNVLCRYMLVYHGQRNMNASGNQTLIKLAEIPSGENNKDFSVLYKIH